LKLRYNLFMTNRSLLSRKDILHLAKLANLSLTNKEIEEYLDQLEDTLSYIDNLKELDTANLLPAARSSNEGNIFFKDGIENGRALTLNETLQNAKKTKDGLFQIPQILNDK